MECRIKRDLQFSQEWLPSKLHFRNIVYRRFTLLFIASVHQGCSNRGRNNVSVVPDGCLLVVFVLKNSLLDRYFLIAVGLDFCNKFQ